MSDMTSAHPISSFDDLRRRLRQLPPADAAAAAAAAARQAELTKPAGALGRLEELALWLAAWQGRDPPALERVAVLVFAGNHGVAARGVSAYPSAVTAQMVANFEAGGAAINQLCRVAAAELTVVPLDLDRPTADFCTAAAMSEAECLAAFQCGMAALPPDLDLLALGEMGIGNTAAAAAICAALYGGPAAWWTGPGSGLDRHGVAHKTAVVGRGLMCHAGGRAARSRSCAGSAGARSRRMAGAILAARERRVPVLLDGFVAGAAAAVLQALEPAALDHVRAAHRSAEPGSRAPARAPRPAPAARPRDATRRGVRRCACDPALPRRARLPHRHGDLRQRRRQRSGVSHRGGAARS